MSVKPIVLVPDQVLRAQSKDVVLDKKLIELVDNLSATLFAKTDPKGVGLSAPQVGKNSNVFVTWLAPNPENEPTENDLKVFINPKISTHSRETTFGPDEDDPILEGCLSIPTLYGPVPRYTWVEVSYDTLSQDKESLVRMDTRFEDFDARVIQHEFDHLNGVLFTDYSLKYDLPVYEFIGKKMKKIEKEIIKAF